MIERDIQAKEERRMTNIVIESCWHFLEYTEKLVSYLAIELVLHQSILVLSVSALHNLGLVYTETKTIENGKVSFRFHFATNTMNTKMNTMNT